MITTSSSYIYQRQVQCLLSLSGHKTDVQKDNVSKKKKSPSEDINTPPNKKSPILTLPLSTWLLSTQNYFPFLSRMTKGKSLRTSHHVIDGRGSILILIISVIIAESVKTSIHVLKLSHDGLKSYTTTRRRGSGGGWNEGGWRSHHLDPWPLRSKLGLTPSNKRYTQGTHEGEVNKLKIGDRGVVNDLVIAERMINLSQVPISL